MLPLFVLSDGVQVFCHPPQPEPFNGNVCSLALSHPLTTVAIGVGYQTLLFREPNRRIEAIMIMTNSLLSIAIEWSLIKEEKLPTLIQIGDN